MYCNQVKFIPEMQKTISTVHHINILKIKITLRISSFTRKVLNKIQHSFIMKLSEKQEEEFLQPNKKYLYSIILETVDSITRQEK